VGGGVLAGISFIDLKNKIIFTPSGQFGSSFFNIRNANGSLFQNRI